MKLSSCICGARARIEWMDYLGQVAVCEDYCGDEKTPYAPLEQWNEYIAGLKEDEITQEAFDRELRLLALFNDDLHLDYETLVIKHGARAVEIAWEATQT